MTTVMNLHKARCTSVRSSFPVGEGPDMLEFSLRSVLNIGGQCKWFGTRTLESRSPESS